MEKVYDLAGVGIGPFNLGLAALAVPINALDAIFFEKNTAFNWHPGMMLGNATLQVAFYADLVTLADPSSKFSFIAYLKAKGRLIKFGILEDNYITRREYNHYCKWVIRQLGNLYFGHQVETINYDQGKDCYQLKVWQINTNELKVFYAKKLVMGVGSVPYVPDCVKYIRNSRLFHSSEYLYHKQEILNQESVTIIGSGQSAAEIFDDLLDDVSHFSKGLHWFTRSERFFPMDYSKLTLEMSTPDYIAHFYRLSEKRKAGLVKHQNMLYKGINYDLINQIYSRLYHATLEENNLPVQLLTNAELRQVKQKNGQFLLTFYHTEMEEYFTHQTDVVILATGYQYEIPAFTKPIKDRIKWDKQNRYRINRNYSIDNNEMEIFVQNVELHSHGFNAADLSLGPYRNAVILNEILGYEYYVMEKENTFQCFGIPQGKESTRAV